MSHEDDNPISKLLRMRRYEQQPPPEYFENFLKEFHLRQRAELLRRPAWRIAVDRLEARFGEAVAHFSFSQLSYAGASVAVLAIAGVFTANMLQHPGTGIAGNNRLPAIASVSLSPSSAMDASLNAAPRMAPAASVAMAAPATVSAEFTLSPEIRIPDMIPNEAPQPGHVRQYPRYILDTRPASYEPPFSF